MVLSRNPMDPRWSTTRKVNFLLYSIFLVTSVWFSGQSFIRTFEATNTGIQIFWYIVAFAILSLASFCLAKLKLSVSNGYVPNRSTLRLFGALGFIVAWLAVLMANSHNIYYEMTIKNQRQKELRNLKTQLELVGAKSITAFNVARKSFESDIATEIKNMKEEIENPNNPGHGGKTSEIIRRIEEKLGGGHNIDMPTNPPSDSFGRRQYANSLASKINEITRERLSIIDSKISELNEFLNREEYKNIVRTLDELIDKFNTISESAVTRGLRNGYAIYDKAREYINQLFSEPLIKKHTTLLIEDLPVTPVSIESESIAYSWGEFLKGGKIDSTRFRWSIFIALLLDLACFLIWYFGVLPDEE